MKRILLTIAALALTATAADAGPIRDRLAARFSRLNSGSCAGCSGPQASQVPAYPGVSYTPGPVQTAAGTVLVQAGQVVQAAGVAVQSVQVPTLFRPSNCPTCVGGECR